ncbi:MAG TPA: CHAT domain-containing protein [Tepidisphaeraceae bacterium]|jgi:CHAT domain-containing protein|nr:CHAT domain-containing protein [Tepidisphaeraceae bacterium]
MNFASHIQSKFSRAVVMALTALGIILGAGCAGSGQPPARALAPSHADGVMRDGAAAYAAGDFGRAASRFELAAREYGDANRCADRCDALLDLAQAEESLGSFPEAANALNAALPLARGLHDEGREIDLLDSLAVVYTFTRNYVEAQKDLSRASSIAGKTHDQKALARLQNTRGSLQAVGGEFESAAKTFADAADRAKDAGMSMGQARALTNEALALLHAAKKPEAIESARAAKKATSALEPSHRQVASLFITQGRVFWQARDAEAKDDAADKALAADALDCYTRAAAIAETVGDHVVLSFALGYQGEVAATEKRPDDALELTRKALFLAQEAQSPVALYRWQWQMGRLLHDAGHNAQAIEAYAAAIKTLKNIHGDLANGYGNDAGTGSFRESVGPIYYEMADLLLQRADTDANAADVQRLLHEAQDTVELLKSGELEDYFHQKCVDILGKKIEQQATGGVAVIYLIPLPDRTEMLVSTGSGLVRFKSPVGAAELTKEVREFRDRLEDRTSNRYLLDARKLYDWIIRPIEPTLVARKIDTLVFVPDGALRTVPMSALNDGKQFLIDKYAVAITPGLTLMMSDDHGNADEAKPAATLALEGGLSVSTVRGFAPLEFVPKELKEVHSLFPDGPELLNQSFTAENFKAMMNAHDYSFVHLASHAEFSHNEGDTFLLTYDRKLTLDDLSRLIERHRYANSKPLELLALSACQTAAGDDRAALGLAGVAIRMGARTAVATLWSVNDEASAELVQRFYQSLRNDPKLSKAKAMQQAQLSLLKDPRYRHPCYWAPFLVIGNWR